MTLAANPLTKDQQHLAVHFYFTYLMQDGQDYAYVAAYEPATPTDPQGEAGAGSDGGVEANAPSPSLSNNPSDWKQWRV